MISFKNILPSKKFSLTLLGIGIGVVLVLVLVQWIQGRDAKLIARKNLEDQQALLAGGAGLSEGEVSRILEIQNKDTDADGLKDWEEGLWGTNPLVADTDEDGISDFQEAQNRRIQVQGENPVGVTIAENEELTPLDIFTRDFYATASLIQQRDVENPDELIKDVFLQNVATLELYTPFAIENINTVAQTETSMINYVRALKTATDQYPLDNQDNLSLVLDIAAGREKETEKNTLAVRNHYQSFAETLSRMAVPEGLKDLHLAMINTSLRLHATINGILNVDDPLTSFSSSLQFTDAVSQFTDAYVRIYDYLQSLVIID